MIIDIFLYFEIFFDIFVLKSLKENIDATLRSKIKPDVKTTVLTALTGSKCKENDELIIKQLGLRVTRETPKVDEKYQFISALILIGYRCF